jgi:hypothetical protein
MSNCKFKIGDHVVVEKSNIDECGSRYAGKTGRVVAYWKTSEHFDYFVKFDENDTTLWCDIKCLVPSDEKIVITHDGKTTTATLYEDGKKVKTATAKCCPEDTFDFMVGAKLACERLSPKTEETEWRVVNRPVKAGDYIRLIRCDYSFDELGDILKVDKVLCDSSSVHVYGKNHKRDTQTSPNFPWCYTAKEYEVVEKVTKTVESPKPKYYNGKVVCIKRGFGSSCPVSSFTIGKVYNVVDGVITSDTGYESSEYRYVNDKDDADNLCAGMGWTFIPFVED